MTSCAASKLLNQSAVCSAALMPRTAAFNPISTSAADRRCAMGSSCRPSCRGTTANVLGRAPSVGRFVVSCRRRTSRRIRLSITRGWRAISALNASGLTRSSSVSRSATSWAECASPEMSDISPTVSPAGTWATRRRWPRSSFTKTPRQPVTTRNKREIVLAGAVQQHAARQAEPVGFGEQASQRRVAEIREQRKLLQPLAQRLRIDRFATGSKGGQKSHVHYSPVRILAYHAVQPPSTASAAPVTKLDAGDARKRSGPRISSARATRPSMVCAANRSAN